MTPFETKAFVFVVKVKSLFTPAKANVAEAAMAAGSGFARIRPNCSSPSGSKSARMGTEKVRFDCPGVKESVAAVAVKSAVTVAGDATASGTVE